MRYRIRIEGISPIIMHCGWRGLDNRSQVSLDISEITKKRGTNRTEADDIRLEELTCYRSFWLDDDGNVTVPSRVLKKNLENAAKKFKEGPAVRGGLIVDRVELFEYDKSLGNNIEELSKNKGVQFTVPVVVNRSRVMNTRARFKKWAVEFVLEVDDTLVNEERLVRWLDIGGRQIGIGDWRPEKSGEYGRYKAVSVEKVEE